VKHDENFERLAALANLFLPPGAVRSIVELGARDCLITLSFRQTWPHAMVYSFECNPATLPVCRERVAGDPQVELVEKAVSDQSGEIRFYPIDPSRTVTDVAGGNPGASSMFRASGKYPLERYAQHEIVVEAVTLEAFLASRPVDQVAILWMDIQGAELAALRGLGPRLADVGVIHLEAAFFEIYQGQPLFADVDAFLNAQGFVFLGFTMYSRYFADAVYVRRALAGPAARWRAIRQHAYLARYWVRWRRHRLKRWLLRRLGRAEWPAPKQ
jgi:FkbM family methyltransferase